MVTEGELSLSNAAIESLQTLSRDDRKLLEEESVERKKLEEEKVSAALQFEKLSKELMDCNDLVVTLQTEIPNLNGQLTSMTVERIKLEEEKNWIFNEFEKQSRDLMEMKIVEGKLQMECSKAVDDLNKAIFRINQLTEENDILNADIEFHKCKVEELAKEKYSSQSEEAISQGVEGDICMLKKPESDWLSQEQQKWYVSNNAGFVTLRKNLENAATVMQQIENEIEAMHMHSISLSGSTDKTVAPGVSRLIQAFESKVKLMTKI